MDPAGSCLRGICGKVKEVYYPLPYSFLSLPPLSLLPIFVFPLLTHPTVRPSICSLLVQPCDFAALAKFFLPVLSGETEAQGMDDLGFP